MAIAGGGLGLAAVPGPAFAASAAQSPAASSPFRIVPSPVVGSGSPALLATTAISAHDVWAVGFSQNGSQQIRPLAEHWNGKTWSVVPTPITSSTAGGEFTAVSAVSSTDVWAIGTGGTEHWNGKAWSIIPLKDPTATNNVKFTGVKAISASNVYAIGAYQGYQDPVQVIEHWNGTSWKVLANPFNFVIPSGIDASSASGIWIVGAQRYGGFTEHFNGTRWSVVPTPARTPDKVTVVSPTSAWAVGYFDISHWNGSSWKVVSTNAFGNHLEAITKVSATDLWAVGYSYPSTSTPITSLAEHFNGTSWSVVPTPSPGTFDELRGVSRAAGGHIYAVGNTNPGTIGPGGAYNPGTNLILENDKG